jgi:hypothetical protein
MEEGTARFGSEGYVYILVNPAFTGYAKIGKTTNDPAIRAKELSSSTGVPVPYAVAWDAVVSDRHYVERLVHRRLAHARARNDREFFAVPLREAVSVLAELGKESDSGCKVLDDDAEVVQSLDRHLPSIGEAERDGAGRVFLPLASNPADHLASQRWVP